MGIIMSNKETFSFNADINQLLSIIINTFYSNKEIFLRELISNSSDALDKIRYESLTNTDALNTENDLRTRISVEDKKLIIEDTGIGMTKEDLINNLGTIAKSGTKAFMEALQAGNNVSMIGQFGVGFYSAYLVADKVTVISKHNTSDDTYYWESEAGGSFSVGKASENLSRGTKLILQMKEDQHEFLQETKLRDLIKTYSQFIDFPIYIQAEKTKDVEVTDDEDDEDDEEEKEDKNNTDDSKVEQNDSKEDDEDNDKPVVEDCDDCEESKEPEKKTKTITETYLEWDHLNEQKPIWTRSNSEVTKEEYNSFYKLLTNDWDDCLVHKHFSVEGQLEFKGLLYIPKRAPNTMFEQDKTICEIKLYVRRVFITDKYKEIIPEYLSFIKGVIDSEDLPLNISREMLQQNKIMKVIRKNLVRKCIEMFTQMSEDDNQDNYNTFYENFSKNIKLGIYEDNTNRSKLAKLLRFHTSNSLDKKITLDEYITNMKENQSAIYYIAGESIESINSSPCLEMLKSNGIEVIYFNEPMDEYMLQQFKEYDGKQFVCITKENLDIGQNDQEKESYKKHEKDLEGVCKIIKETLDDKIEKVIISKRLAESPCTLVTNSHGWSANMERILKAQALRDTSMDNMMNSKKIMEI